ncbi:hypothetical protein J4455_01455 [Candidatus Woesearchaeota archaeon]|nr:hypothetical protein [uncultured archaeon]AQS32225.1 hypothetical protein [uncultured archaeon]MBS3149345.1 hypothetical protein [Candidatus Woesearchaeota archaeon]
MNKTITYIAIILVLMNFVVAGVVFPIPDLELKPGESGRFQFLITGSPPLKCTVNPDHKTPLNVEFDNMEVIIESQSQPYFGTITAPKDTKYGKYTETFCVSCEALGEGGGSSLRQSFCDVPINVEVVGERTKENIQFPEKPKEKIDAIAIIGLIVLIILIIVLILFGIKKPRNIKK